MSKYSGIFAITSVMQNSAAGKWYGRPCSPTIGTATVTANTASITFTPSANTNGSTVISYTAISNTGISNTNTTSPVSVTGLTKNTAYTFTVVTNSTLGSSASSSASNSILAQGVPNAPTIGTATISGTTACISFTSPACNGANAITSYTATSCPGSITGTGASSPISVSGLTGGTSYTFKVKATNGIGTGPCSSTSNSVTAQVIGSASYTTPGTYSWVAPTGVTSVSVVAVGAGTKTNSCGGGGGGLGWKNNISVTPGNSYTVVAGGQPAVANAVGCSCSYFINKTTVAGLGPTKGLPCVPNFTLIGGSYVGDGGGSGGGGYRCYQCNRCQCNPRTAYATSGGGGAGGYTGNGGQAGIYAGSYGADGFSGSGGGGGGGAFNGGGGGGVGIYGQGSNGAGGQRSRYCGNIGGGGGGSGGSPGGCKNSCYNRSGSAGNYGGGVGGRGATCCSPIPTPSTGAVRIIWPGSSRRYPSTSVGSP
jgi:hypothetical protein